MACSRKSVQRGLRQSSLGKLTAAARALYESDGDAEQMALFGFSPEDYDETFEVWPDNWKAFLVMDSMGTQWRTGACGATGLDYGVLPDVMKLVGVPVKDRPGMFQDIRIMESEAIASMAESRQRIGT